MAFLIFTGKAVVITFCVTMSCAFFFSYLCDSISRLLVVVDKIEQDKLSRVNEQADKNRKSSLDSFSKLMGDFRVLFMTDFKRVTDEYVDRMTKSVASAIGKNETIQ